MINNFFINDITEKTYNDLLEYITDINLDVTEKIILIIDSDGGESRAMNMILDLINDCNDLFEMRGYKLFSSALELFLGFEGEKYLSQQVVGMIHKPTAGLQVGLNKKNQLEIKEDRFQKELIQSLLISEDKILIDLLSKLGEDKVRQYNKGEDVFLSMKDIMSLM